MCALKKEGGSGLGSPASDFVCFHGVFALHLPWQGDMHWPYLIPKVACSKIVHALRFQLVAALFNQSYKDWGHHKGCWLPNMTLYTLGNGMTFAINTPKPNSFFSCLCDCLSEQEICCVLYCGGKIRPKLCWNHCKAFTQSPKVQTFKQGLRKCVDSQAQNWFWTLWPCLEIRLIFTDSSFKAENILCTFTPIILPL